MSYFPPPVRAVVIPADTLIRLDLGRNGMAVPVAQVTASECHNHRNTND